MLLLLLLLITGGIQAIHMESTEDSDTDDRESYKTKRDELNSVVLQAKPQQSVLCPFDWEGFLPHPSSCSYYFRCASGQSSLRQCEGGLLFDSISGECRDSTIAQCQNNTSKLLDNACTKQLDAYYPNYTETCQQYYRCQGGNLASKILCPEGQAFSFSYQTCLPQHQVSCIRPECHIENNDFFWMPGSYCQSYYYCESGQPLYFLCPKGHAFDKTTKECIKGGQCFEPICVGKADGDHPDTSHDCTRSLHCRSGAIESIKSCPADQKFQGTSCVPSILAQCAPPEHTTVVVESTGDDCQGYSNGINVIKGTGCRRYQLCEEGRVLARMVCPTNLRFDGIQCAAMNTVVCEDSCSNKEDGYYADENEGCRKYHFCREGQTVERLSCPDGSLFSGSMCLPAVLVNCREKSVPPSNLCIGLKDGFHANYLKDCNPYVYCSKFKSVLNSSCPSDYMWHDNKCVLGKESLCSHFVRHEDCHGRKTGLYRDKASNCSKYYYCHNGNRTLVSCPEGKVFNGEICVNEGQYVCPSQEPDTCYNKTDGYHINLDSNCNSYYYCTNGEKVTYVCSGSQIFNGSSCVPLNQYQCPFISDVCKNKTDGYYADLTTGCRKYFYCRKGSKITTLSCGLKKSFDGDRCVPSQPSDDVCHRAALRLTMGTACQEGETRFHSTKSCRSYDYCVRGHWVMSSCSEDTLFNGESCIDRNNFTCTTDVR